MDLAERKTQKNISPPPNKLETLYLLFVDNICVSSPGHG